MESISSVSITILTATYNRAHLLPRLYQSISLQTYDVEKIDWLIIDDGSDDETTTLIESFMLSANQPITYIKIAHGGKHRALNEGFKHAKGDWVFIVDSDDWLKPSGLNFVQSAVEQAQNMGASIVQMPLVVPKAKKQYFFNKPDCVLSFAQRFVQEPEFDHSIIFSSAMMRYQFPEFEGELFIAESALIYQMLNENIYICNDAAVFAEYQPNGLSANMLRNRMQSSLGSCHVYQQQLKANLSARAYSRSLANFGRFWWHSILRGEKACTPKSLPQCLVISLSWPFALFDIYNCLRYGYHPYGVSRCQSDYL